MKQVIPKVSNHSTASQNLPLVLIPGMMCDHRLFAPQVQELSKSRQVFVPRTDQGETIADIATYIFTQVPWATFALGGLSMGGIIAMEMINQQPDRIVGVALMDTNPWAEKAEVKAARQPQIALAEQCQHLKVIKEQMAPNYGRGTTISEQSQLTLVLDMAEQLGAEVFIQQSMALASRSDQASTLTHFHGPSLVLCGEHDQLCPLDRHEAMATYLPNNQFHVVPAAGHLITLQAPSITNQHLHNWLTLLEA
ncbi:alpha/beta hydrolase [Marinomonas agarivorans]|nr:alpha/beta hydrolase [Marinomonas agarivorans]